LAKKRVRRNYYKNSGSRKKARILSRMLFGARLVLLVACMGGTSLLFILAHDALTQSSHFEARQITVEGNARLSKEAVLRQAGVKLNDNILAINLKVLRDNLLGDPWIAQAEVERELPGAIHIRIKEQVPVAVIELNRPYFLSEAGQIFKPVEPSDYTDVPVVTGLKLSDIDPGNPGRSLALGAIMEVIRLTRLHGSVLPSYSVHGIHADSELGLTLFGFPNKMVIKLGFEDYESKFDRLRDMIAYLTPEDGLQHVGCVDLNDRDRVVIEPSDKMSLLGVCYRKEM
jgi:cell division protein FtsQ